MPRKLCILAGGGRLPGLLVENCERHRRPYAVIAFRDQANADDFSTVSEIAWHRLGAGRAILRSLRTFAAEDVVLVGSIRRPGLFALMPDWWTLWVAITTRALSKGDDGLLRIVARLFESDTRRVVGIADVAPELLTPSGVLTTLQPSEADHRDIDIATQTARDLGNDDIGQAAAARAGNVIAREDRHGTDAMLKKIAAPAENALGVLAKCVKPGQDRRLDLPAIGPDTVANVAAAGLKGIVLDAGASLIIDHDETIAAADAAGIFIVGRPHEG